MADMVAAEDKRRGEVARWVKEIQLYEKEFNPWEERVKKIVRRYKDERKNRSDETKGKYNILWSNIQTLLPAVYAQNPNPNVERRNTQKEDPVASRAAEVIERALNYFVKEDDFFDTMEQCVLDRLLGGRATSAVRYVPEFGDEVEVTNDPTASSDPELLSEKIEFDYNNWLDFGHTWGRTWDEVRATWKCAYLTRDEGIKRFGDAFKLVQLDYTPEKLNDEKVDDGLKKARIYEIWDKETKQVIWISKSYPLPLDQKPDPLHVKNFFPWPKPLYATLANDSLIPTPDFTEYQDQAQELDELTARIRYITKAIKVAGVYDSSAPGIERLMVEGNENILIPVANWAVFGEKGGLAGAMSLLPMAEISQTLLTLYEARDKVKQDLNEISGVSDIVRGQGDASETATAQKIKGNFATMRLDRIQKQTQRFVRDNIRIGGEIIAEHFSLKTLQDISGISLPTQAEKQQFQVQQQMAQQPGQQPPPQPDEKVIELMQEPTWEEVYAFLKDDRLRSFRIDIETDSTIKMDQDAERQARMEFLTAAGGFLTQMQEIQNPALIPLAGEMLKFGIGAFKVGKDLQSCFDYTIDKLEKDAAQPKPPQQDPEMVKQQGEAQRQQMELQHKGEMEQVNAQKEAQLTAMKEQAQTQRDQMKAAHEAQMEAIAQNHEKDMKALEIAFDSDKAKMDNETKIIVAKISAATSLRTASMSADAAKKSKVGIDDIDENGEPLEPETTLDDVVETVSQNLQQMFSAHQELASHVANLTQQVTAPKKIIRDASGKMSGVVIDDGVMH